MKRIISMVMVVVLILGIATTAFATTYSNSYGQWVISASSVRTANNVKKTVSGVAKVNAITQTPSDQVVWYGLRNSSGTKRVHEDAVGRSSRPTTDISIAYESGYGTVGTSYCLAVQNDSESTQSVTVRGTWRP